MKWPDNPALAATVRKQLEQRIARYLAEDDSPDGGNDPVAVKNLVDDLWLIYRQCAHGTAEAAVLQRVLTKLARSWDTDDPAHAHIQKFTNRLYSGRAEDAAPYLDKAINGQFREARETARRALTEQSSRGAKAKHRETTEAVAKMLDYYALHGKDYPSKKVAAYDLAEKFPALKPSTIRKHLKTVGR